jgi:hypothetical protein
MSAVNTIKEATKTGVNTIKASRGHSDHAAELRKQLGISALLAGIAGTAGFFALRAMHQANQKAEAHMDWKSEDKKLDRDIETTLDASDAVAKY